MRKDNDTLQNKNNELNEKIEKLQVFFYYKQNDTDPLNKDISDKVVLINHLQDQIKTYHDENSRLKTRVSDLSSKYFILYFQI